MIDSAGVVRIDREREQRLRAAERRLSAVSRLLDEFVPIPGTGQRVGVDAVLGLVPGVGDLASMLMGGWIIVEAVRFGLPRVVVLRMILNSVVDVVVGAVPLLGDLFDVAFRSNRYNLDLFRRHAADPHASTAADRAFVAGVVLIAVGVVALLLVALGRLLSVEIPTP